MIPHFSSRELPPARQHDPEFGELSRLCFDVDASTVLLYDDVVTHRETEPGSFTRRFRCEERVEHLCLHLGRNTRAVVANPHFNCVTEISRTRGEHRLERCLAVLAPALADGIEAVGNQVQEYARDLLRENLERTGHVLEIPPQGN